ncbi:MAG: T9SS type A sorting domain-containing protein [Dysgonamonadaceae bacterium]|nr:T9SS type A sorting domain-containing protein [Dysgonamonadaceae bacterium]
MSIYGVQGNLVRQAIPNVLSVNVSLAGVSAGVYIVRVATASGLQSEKIIISQ